MFMNGIAIDGNLTKNPLDDQHRSESKKQLSRRAVRVPLFLGCLLHHWQSLVKALYTRTMVVLKSKPWPKEKIHDFLKALFCFDFYVVDILSNLPQISSNEQICFKNSHFCHIFSGKKDYLGTLFKMFSPQLFFIFFSVFSTKLVYRRNVTKTATFYSEIIILVKISSVLTLAIYQHSANWSQFSHGCKESVQLFNFLYSFIFKCLCLSPIYTETAASRGLLDSSLALSLLHVDMKSLQPHCRSRKRPFFGKGREDGELEEAIYFAKQISSRFSVPRISRPPAWRKRPPLAWRILTTSGAGFWGLGMLLHFKALF